MCFYLRCFARIYYFNWASRFPITRPHKFHFFYYCHSLNDFAKYNMFPKIWLRKINTLDNALNLLSVIYNELEFLKTTKSRSRDYPSRCGWRLKSIKNWDPLVFGPQFAIERTPAPSWSSLKFSSVGIMGIYWVKISTPQSWKQRKRNYTWKLPTIDALPTSACKPTKVLTNLGIIIGQAEYISNIIRKVSLRAKRSISLRRCIRDEKEP